MELFERVISYGSSITPRRKEGLTWVLQHGEDSLPRYPNPNFQDWYLEKKPVFFQRLDSIIDYFQLYPQSALVFRVLNAGTIFYWGPESIKKQSRDWSSQIPGYWSTRSRSIIQVIEDIEISLKDSFLKRIEELDCFDFYSDSQMVHLMKTPEFKRLMKICLELQVKMDRSLEG